VILISLDPERIMPGHWDHVGVGIVADGDDATPWSVPLEVARGVDVPAELEAPVPLTSLDEGVGSDRLTTPIASWLATPLLFHGNAARSTSR
jgi:hypothetical protein